MNAVPTKSDAVELVELHYFRHEGTSSFLVVVPDDALVKLNQGHALRGLTIAFNGIGRKSKRVADLAKAMQEAEDAGIVKPEEKPPGRIRRAWRRVAHWIVAVTYPAVRWCKGEREGASL